jgi:hypothetical protein
MKKNKNKSWFVAVRGSYLPSSLTGMVIYLLYITYVVALIIGWYIEGHNYWDLLIFVIPLSIGAMLITQHIASKHTK